ncbi:adhesin transport system outer membrane protein [Hoeflea marina]|uniref:Adhesin transport system outer membrane protein n=1 Tax=Hoeflea marina TaxID=274592 RepID=A0A317PSI9_9HYPH|nr:TolC family outer membrane protein [Hoeflea marina]PWW04139.1 adhesin transport system outer membrane protein [Hoeflea marina]
MLKKAVVLVCLSSALSACFSGPSLAMSLKEAVSEALGSNPEVLAAAENREAVEFELRQARGLYLPTLDLEASAGGRLLDTPARRRLGTDDESLDIGDAGLTLRQTLFDGGARRSELERQAARVDGASFRVLERSEAIALAVSQEYFEILLQAEIVAIARQNAGVLSGIVDDISAGVSGGTLTSADRTQGRERLLSARARLKEAEEDLEEARIRFARLVGVPLRSADQPPSLSRALPRSADAAVEQARSKSPRIAAAGADADASDAMVRGARAAYLPTVSFEARARVGSDIDGAEGRTSDLEAKVVARWNLYRGGRDQSAEQERIRRAGEARQNLVLAHREVTESILSAWNRKTKRAEQAATLREQTASNMALVSAYRDQFRVGDRSLLDVLSAQNTRFNSDVLAKTTQYASRFADYQLLAAMGVLVETLKLNPVEQAEPYAREAFKAPADAPEPVYARIPSRQVADGPLDLLATIRR